MPLLFYGPGGGGGGNGYKYPSEDVAGISYGRDADGNLTLSWSDPEDGGPAAEWKGTVVVCKEGEPPRNIDDGEIVCESAVKNQYRDAGLILDVGGPGYYYGVFPYTKDYVVNANEANVAYIPNDGYNVALKNASWSDVAYISSQGIAGQVWSVGDEKDIVLAGKYTGSVTMQIAGFNHDNLVSGGKAGITFVSKQVIGSVGMTTKWWPETSMWEEVEAVYSSLPDNLKKVIKTVNKTCLKGYVNYSPQYEEVQMKAFAPSAREVAADYIAATSSLRSYCPEEGAQYDIFKGGMEKHIRETVNGETADWWTRSSKKVYSSAFLSWYSVRKSGDVLDMTWSVNQPFCFGFCI